MKRKIKNDGKNKKYFKIVLILLVILIVILISYFFYKRIPKLLPAPSECLNGSSVVIQVIDPGFSLLNESGYVIKNKSSLSVAIFNNSGNIYLAGRCNFDANCGSSESLFVVKNNLGEVVSYIDSNGNLCIEQGSCSGGALDCNIISSGFLVKDATGKNISYVDSAGKLCLVGTLFENQNTANLYTLTFPNGQTTYKSVTIKIKKIFDDRTINVTLRNSTNTTSSIIRNDESIIFSGLEIKNIAINCITSVSTAGGGETDGGEEGGVSVSDYQNRTTNASQNITSKQTPFIPPSVNRTTTPTQQENVSTPPQEKESSGGFVILLIIISFAIIAVAIILFIVWRKYRSKEVDFQSKFVVNQ